MKDFWGSSKSTALTLALTGFVGICVLIFAYHLHHYTEILNGVISGLTIILGMVTAEWLRSAREDSAANVSRLHTLQLNYYSLVLNPEFLLEDDTLSLRFQEQIKMFYDIGYQLDLLATKTRWLQPNAKKIRLQSLLLNAKSTAMFRDAVENRHLWSVEERHGLQLEMLALAEIALSAGKKESDLSMDMYLKSRKTEPREGMSLVWLKQAEREKER